MNTIFPRSRHHHPAIHRRCVGKQIRTIRSDNTKQRISGKLIQISDKYGVDDLVIGFVNSFYEHAYNSLNLQLGNSSLPTFLKDELHTSLQEQRRVYDKDDWNFCQIECDTVCQEFYTSIQNSS